MTYYVYVTHIYYIIYVENSFYRLKYDRLYIIIILRSKTPKNLLRLLRFCCDKLRIRLSQDANDTYTYLAQFTVLQYIYV